LWQDDLGHRLYGYLDAMLAAGAADSMDALSWHPYDNSAGFTVFEPEVDGIAATLRVAGHADMRIVAGEVGSAAPDNAQSNRLTSEYTRLDARDSRLDLVGNYDMFAGFVDVEKTNPPAERAYGWVTQKNWLGKFQAKRVFCDFRDLLGFGRPVPKYVLNCPLF
jgi:hypothetical protein